MAYRKPGFRFVTVEEIRLLWIGLQWTVLGHELGADVAVLHIALRRIMHLNQILERMNPLPLIP